MPTEQTLMILKPDAVMRGLMADVLGRFERTGLHFQAMKLVWTNRALAEAHYEEHVGKGFYDELIEFIMTGPVLATVIGGVDAVAQCRKLRGPTNPADAFPGTITGDLCHSLHRGRNLVHASSDPDAAKREIDLWFTADEIHSYDRYDAPATLGTLA